MKQTALRRSARLAGFVLLGTMALVAQSSAGNSGANELIVPTVQSQIADSKSAAPSISISAIAKDQAPQNNPSNSPRSWLSAGPTALPATVRVDPLFDPPMSRYGAAPASVQFHFGKK